jgi:hypothetical protein
MPMFSKPGIQRTATTAYLKLGSTEGQNPQ